MTISFRRQLQAEGLETRRLLAVIGDANSDGMFDESDLVVMFQAGKYQLDQPAEQSEGDWNGDKRFDTDDLIMAFQSGNYLNADLNNLANTVRLSAGSSDRDFADAISVAGRNGIVIVESGTHTSSSVMITDPVTIVGEDGAVMYFDTAGSNAAPVVIDAAIHVMNTQHVNIEGLDVRSVNDVGGTAILIEQSQHVSIEDNALTDFQFGVLIQRGDHSLVVGNQIAASSAWQTNDLAIVNGINVVNGFGNRLHDNIIHGAAAAIFVSGENGKIFDNTVSGNFIGILLCTNATDSFQLPDGNLAGADFAATRWTVQGNTSTGNLGEGFLVIDGANNNVLTNNTASDNGTYDIELATDTMRFGFLAPASYGNLVNAESEKEMKVKDCGNDNQVHGGVLVDTDVDPCS